MQVHRNLTSLPSFKNAVVTIGTFDGVHLGHQKIIALLKATAAKAGGESVIITFHPHPRSVIMPQQGNAVSLLTTLNEKIELLEKAGIEHLVVVPFDEAFAAQSAEAYVDDFLFKTFHPHTIIIGYDHKFGHNRTGNYQLLEAKGKILGFAVKEIPEEVLNEITISSTAIRRSIAENRIEQANQFLGYAYFFEGEVIKGNQLGRTIGYPTANLQIKDADKLLPANGVYAVEVCTQLHGWQKGMMNIGNRPTVNGTTVTTEVHLFDFDEILYHQNLKVFVKTYLRSETKFNGLEALKLQLAADAAAAKKVLAN